MTWRRETIGDVTLYLGDCREILPTLGPVDAVVTDPPYGVGFAHYESHKDKFSEYQTVVDRVLECEPLLTEQGFMCVFQSATHATRWAKWFPREFRPIALTKAFVQMRAHFITAATDYALVWWPTEQPPNTKPPWQPNGARDWFYSAETAVPRSGPERDHPCPRPLDMMLYLVSRLAPPDTTILDPFMGSGTTGVAALKLGRRFIGIEIEPTYFDIACRRIEEAWRQPRLFEERAPAEQVPLDLGEEPRSRGKRRRMA
jgi:DNA modification methylase